MSSPAAAPFSQIAIVGLGLIGGSVAFAAKRAWPSARLVAADRRPAVVREALARRAIDAVADELSHLADAELIILAAPVQQNLALLPQIAAHASRSAVITDVGGTKRAIVTAASGLPVTFVGGHPLGGGARGGFEFATAGLFERRPWILTLDGADQTAVSRLSAFVAGLGAKPTTMTADEHDRLMAYLSHLPQLTASVLMTIVGDAVGVSGLNLAGPGLVDTTRLASSPADVWRDVCATNTDAIGDALDVLISGLTRIRSDLQGGGAIDQLFDEAARWRAELLKGRD